ncbi:hypothetical protein SARC_00566 [Sphaeroforma arctica JP610]|uniref:Uncharacterized protein n=1 Tax=Sphaeroforma arctica JP610 TaxID=667725 RepID=A0A0L0GEK6_9EUKA|nr:hypothetical protein SARC_00566 [Sphaeroforma arctica JP610]KNC87324.1 hypothetical protein SARC_00566 [Sphaeroforma arctica JP610]|eukprot:XP_014161226.1 hypothetical protein SARC_00566 [Sphaeroforma arctica JP610]
MVKTNKKKGQPIALTSTENTTRVLDNSGKWTVEKYKDILRSVNGPLGGGIETLRKRCLFLKDLQAHGIGSVLGLKTEDARKLCNQLDLSLGSKVEVVERIGKTLLNPSARQQNGAIISAVREG